MQNLGGREGPTIAGFHYVKMLGYGGFSDVYLYKQKLPRRHVAIKVLHVDALDIKARKQFVAEANLMAQVSSHPAIATIYSAGISDDNQPYFVMEYCSGGTLNSVYRTTPLSIPDVLRTGVRVASALESAHAVGIFHRDVKPGNILITDYGLPVLTDFGISIGDDGVDESTMFQDAHLTEASGSGSPTMSIPWAPPEALGHDLPVGTARSDIYSLGATLFGLLEGRSPFEIAGGNNMPAQLLRRIESGEVSPLTRVGVPDRLRGVIAQMMATDPSNRPASARAVAEALQAIEVELGLPATPIEVRQGGLDDDPTPAANVTPATPSPAPVAGLPVWNLDSSTASPLMHSVPQAPGLAADPFVAAPTQAPGSAYVPMGSYLPLEPRPLRHPRRRAPFVAAAAAVLVLTAGVAAVAIVPGLVAPTSAAPSQLSTNTVPSETSAGSEPNTAPAITPPRTPDQILGPARFALEDFSHSHNGSYDATLAELVALGYDPDPDATDFAIQLGQFGAAGSPYCISVVVNRDGGHTFSILKSGPAVPEACPPSGQRPPKP